MSGTYIAVRVHPESEKIIRAYIEQNKIPVVYPSVEARRHVTLISTDDDFVKDFIPAESNVMHFAVPNGFEVLPTQKGGRSLVLTLHCPSLVHRHDEILSKYECEDRYPVYKVHVTLSYDIGDANVDNLPPFTAPILLGEEYCETFKTDWVK